MTRCSIVISMREVLAFWVVAPGRSEIRTRPYDPSLSGWRKCIFYLARFDAASGGRAAASSVTLRMTEPRRTTTGRETPAPARSGRRPRTTSAKAAGGKRSSSSLGDQVLALATGRMQQKSPLHARRPARTMSAPPLPVVMPASCHCSTSRTRRRAIQSAIRQPAIRQVYR